MEKAEIAVIGGTGFEKFFRDEKQMSVETPYGTVSALSIGIMKGRKTAFIARHGRDHSVPPHKVNYRANIYALGKLGVERAIATNAVGAINRDIGPRDVVIPHDFVDFTKSRVSTFYDEVPVTHVDFSQPYCPEMRRLLINCGRKQELRLFDQGAMVCTEGPRYETPAEIEMFRRLACDVVGMTGYPENVLARELEMCYASVCYVTNMAAGIQERLKVGDLSETSNLIIPKVEQLLIETVGSLPPRRGSACSCSSALENARFK